MIYTSGVVLISSIVSSSSALIKSSTLRNSSCIDRPERTELEGASFFTGLTIVGAKSILKVGKGGGGGAVDPIIGGGAGARGGGKSKDDEELSESFFEIFRSFLELIFRKGILASCWNFSP